MRSTLILWGGGHQVNTTVPLKRRIQLQFKSKISSIHLDLYIRKSKTNRKKFHTVLVSGNASGNASNKASGSPSGNPSDKASGNTIRNHQKQQPQCFRTSL
mmetsp:Transcript_19953/g.41305  ORF Transcript_19953/g.41305 Transcript_19953/m.41305 type:complete len:101 (+) Transcript_19953:2266-2568(+)